MERAVDSRARGLPEGNPPKPAGLDRAALLVRLRHILLFAALGGVGTAAHYAVLITLVQGGLAGPVAGSTAGFLVGALVNYQFSRHVVFRSAKPHREAMTKFFLVAGVGLLLNAGLMALIAGRLGVPYLLAQVGVTGLLVLWHYGANAVWTFREKGAPAAGGH
ncbi:putative flippase GtrA [Angulomicrobium tetraedrale]|uniref:Putative flippase GtrA n=1 Tax=Ancylobacter tetraedralis TaxID=217068 RepID=A0A839ZE93_9HYPH|nr:GtrA family protein [Ancylobacter tetraedralis]MBB3773200.1 putative flippase GtrA [Ancylobacter tetraedralis]